MALFSPKEAAPSQHIVRGHRSLGIGCLGYEQFTLAERGQDTLVVEDPRPAREEVQKAEPIYQRMGDAQSQHRAMGRLCQLEPGQRLSLNGMNRVDEKGDIIRVFKVL